MKPPSGDFLPVEQKDGGGEHALTQIIWTFDERGETIIGERGEISDACTESDGNGRLRRTVWLPVVMLSLAVLIACGGTSAIPTPTPAPTPTPTAQSAPTPEATQLPVLMLDPGLPGFEVGPEPLVPVFDGENLWVPSFVYGHVTKISPDGKLLGTFRPGLHTVGDAVSDGESIWISNLIDHEVLRLALDGTLLDTIEVISPARLLYDGENIWVSSSREGKVHKFSRDGTKLGEFDAGKEPGVMVSDGESIWVANRIHRMLTRLALDGTHLGTLHVGGEDNEILDLVFDGEDLWAAQSFEGTVTRLSRDGTERDTFKIARLYVESLLFDGEKIWVGTGRDEIVYILALDGTVLRTLKFDDLVTGMVLVGEDVWIAVDDTGGALVKVPKDIVSP